MALSSCRCQGLSQLISIRSPRRNVNFTTIFEAWADGKTIWQPARTVSPLSNKRFIKTTRNFKYDEIAMKWWDIVRLDWHAKTWMGRVWERGRLRMTFHGNWNSTHGSENLKRQKAISDKPTARAHDEKRKPGSRIHTEYGWSQGKWLDWLLVTAVRNYSPSPNLHNTWTWALTLNDMVPILLI